MKNYKCILWLFFLVFSVYGQSVERVGNPDDKAKIERPCPTYDLNCIRAFFQKHAHCKKTFGPVPDPISRPQDNFYIPRINTSFIAVDQRVSGLNGRIEEFYINRETDKLVIAVEFQNLTQTSDKLYSKFHRRAREPVITTTFYIVTYDPLTITAVIPKLDNLQLHDAECTTYITGQTPVFAVTPNLIASTDPQPALAIAEAFTNLGTDIQEIFLTDSAYFIATYIQYNICDFGLLLT